jgi:hypothetical protein
MITALNLLANLQRLPGANSELLAILPNIMSVFS